MSTDAEAQARELGWRPKDEYSGDPAKWVDADQYLKNGESIVPYLRADRRKLLTTVEGLRTRLDQQEAVIRANNESMEALKKVTATTRVNQLEDEVRSLRSQLVTARNSGNIETEAQVEEQLDQTREQLRDARKQRDQPAAPPPPPVNGSTNAGGRDVTQQPEFQQFLADNPWFQTDEVMAGAAVALMKQKSADPGFLLKTPGQRFAMVAQEIKARFGLDDSNNPPPTRRDSKVEGGNRSEGTRQRGGGAGSSKRSYSDLSPEARAICDRQAKSLVGPKGSGRAFETIDAWRAHYASQVEE